MDTLGKIHGREVISITKLLQHKNAALVGFYHVVLADRSEQLLSPEEVEAHRVSGFLSAEGLGNADAVFAESQAKEAEEQKAPEEEPVEAAKVAEAPKASDLGGKAPEEKKAAKSASKSAKK